MGQQSEIINITLLGADVEPLDLKGAKQVVMTCTNSAGSARIFQNASATGAFFPLDVTNPNPMIFNSNDGYLYLQNANTGGATNATVFVWLVF